MNFWLKSGIYKISSVIRPDKYYIGSAVNFLVRRNRHFRDLKNGTHYNEKLQRYFNKHGPASLNFELLFLCPVKDLLKWEQHFLNYKKPYFNLCPTAGSRLGTIHSIFTRNKIAKSWKHRKPLSLMARLVKYKK